VKPPSTYRVGFLTYPGSRFRDFLLRAKYVKMRWERNVYPDVYSLALFSAPRFDMIPMGTRVRPGGYDLLFSELNGTVEQISYLLDIVRTSGSRVAVIPGPPQVLGRVLTAEKGRLVESVLRECHAVLAYSTEVAGFADGLAGTRRSIIVPWPFDYSRTQELGKSPRKGGEPKAIRILFNIPIRFTDATTPSPLALRQVLRGILAELPLEVRRQFSFHTFAYAPEERAMFQRLGMDDDFPIRLEPSRGYSSFLRFVGTSSAIINYTSSGILGRLGFTAAALELPGLMSANVPLHRALYPSSHFEPFDLAAFRDAARTLLGGLVTGEVPRSFLPDDACAQAVGAFAANAARFRVLLAASVVPAPPFDRT